MTLKPDADERARALIVNTFFWAGCWSALQNYDQNSWVPSGLADYDSRQLARMAAYTKLSKRANRRYRMGFTLESIVCQRHQLMNYAVFSALQMQSERDGQAFARAMIARLAGVE